ncbi:hypothetical protein, partial [Pseudomonas asiatica]|uniref:hypothetical protein n=1 Tax=Pseudomonas asiatica TaxID=2219225 RepID=UPI001E2A324C
CPVSLDHYRDYKRQLKESVARKLAIANQQSALFEAQLDETLKYTERYLTLLARWELMWPDETPPTASDEDVSKLVESKMKDLKDKLAYIAFRDAVTTDRGHDER